MRLASCIMMHHHTTMIDVMLKMHHSFTVCSTIISEGAGSSTRPLHCLSREFAVACGKWHVASWHHQAQHLHHRLNRTLSPSLLSPAPAHSTQGKQFFHPLLSNCTVRAHPHPSTRPSSPPLDLGFLAGYRHSSPCPSSCAEFHPTVIISLETRNLLLDIHLPSLRQSSTATTNSRTPRTLAFDSLSSVKMTSTAPTGGQPADPYVISFFFPINRV